mgnify:CR=1 FL=1
MGGGPGMPSGPLKLPPNLQTVRKKQAGRQTLACVCLAHAYRYTHQYKLVYTFGCWVCAGCHSQAAADSAWGRGWGRDGWGARDAIWTTETAYQHTYRAGGYMTGRQAEVCLCCLPKAQLCTKNTACCTQF